MDADIALRPVQTTDLAFLCRFYREPELVATNWYGYRDLGSLERRYNADGYLGAEDGRLIVTVDDQPAGFVDWSPAGHGAGKYRSIGIALVPEQRGRGVGTHAQRLLCRYLFAHTAIQRIEAATLPDNIAEQRALDRIGFTREGLLRSAEFIEGEYRDVVVYGLLRDDQR